MSKERIYCAGLGFSAHATSAEIVAAVQKALQEYGLTADQLLQLVSLEAKRESAALREAAGQLSLPLCFVALARCEDLPTLTRSTASLAATGLSSVSEAAALAGCEGQGRLLGRRIICGPVTCALAGAERV